MRLVGCGDSWCWGAELVDPAEEPTPIMELEGDNFWRQQKPINVKYREKHRYLNILGEKLNATEIIDLSKPAFSNEAIIRVLIQWLSSEGYTRGRDTSELFISIGWTSPERREFYTSSGKEKTFSEVYYELGPWSLDKDHGNPDINDFFKTYVIHFWREKEFMTRWIHDVFKTEALLKHLNIKYVMHQAFYHYYQKMANEWNDKKYKEEAFEWLPNSEIKLWEDIDPVRFMNKDDEIKGTAHHYLLNQAAGDFDQVMLVWHPNEYGHHLWAEYLYNYITENKLC